LSTAVDRNATEAAKRPGRLWTYLADRAGLDAMVQLGVKKRVPIHASTLFYFLGGMALFLFAVQVATGVLLSLYYKPSPEQAFTSVQAIMTEVKFGWLIRSVHSWGANLIVGVLFLHVLTTYMMRAYRRPREITWATGILLLGLFMALGFSGYLLPWNKLSFFATRVGTGLAGKVPVVGRGLLLLARGGEDVTGDTLSRFYALHVAIFPLAALALVGLHLYLVQRHGMSIPDRAVKRYGGQENVPSMPFLPHFLVRDAVGWYLALAILAALAALFPWKLGEKADPFGSAPPGIQPEWYFLFMFQALKLLPGLIVGLEGEMVGVLFFGFVGLVVLLVPVLDRGRATRLVLNILTALAVIFFIVMTAWGWFPGEPRLSAILGTGLLLGILLLAVPFSERGSPARWALGALILFAAVGFIAVIVWELYTRGYLVS
jgi:quinol-cytochrome oxidoreductase complex cytochrome b subunit